MRLDSLAAEKLIINIPNTNCTVLPEHISFGVDNESAEIAKVSHFSSLLVSSLKPKANIGVLLPPGYDGEVAGIERWPLIQSFAANSSKTGFFTEYYNVHDVSAAFFKVIISVDALSLKSAMVGTNRLARNIEVSLSTVTKTRNSARLRGKLAEIEVADAVECFYEFGKPINSDAINSEICFDNVEEEEEEEEEKEEKEATSAETSFRGARVLFGNRTGLINSKSVVAELSMDICMTNKMEHFVMESEEPLHGVRCARTYFVQTGVVPVSVNDSPPPPPSPPLSPPPPPTPSLSNSNSKLSNTYNNLIQFFQHSVEAIIKEFSSHSVSPPPYSINNILKFVKNLAKKAHKFNSADDHFVVVADLMDGFGRSPSSPRTVVNSMHTLTYLR